MDPDLSHAWIGAIAGTMAIAMTIAIFVERLQRWRDRADGVLFSWDDLRFTASHLIVGSGRDVQRFLLDGLSAKVEVIAAPEQSDDEVHLIIENADQDIRRRQPYSYGASGNAQMFAIKFNMLSGHPHTARDLHRAAADHQSHRHAA
jgi:hypothetical protein